MQCPTCPFYRFRRHRALDCATGVHSTADTTWNKQPGEETHLHSLAVNGCAEKITCRLPAPINTASKLDPTSLPGHDVPGASREPSGAAMASVSAPARRDGRERTPLTPIPEQIHRIATRPGVSRPDTRHINVPDRCRRRVGNWCALPPVTRGRNRSYSDACRGVLRTRCPGGRRTRRGEDGGNEPSDSMWRVCVSWRPGSPSRCCARLGDCSSPVRRRCGGPRAGALCSRHLCPAWSSAACAIP
jgi:hypothetical protein